MSSLTAYVRRTLAPAGLSGGFWRIWTASTISGLGDGIGLVAIPLLAARVTRDPEQISLITAVEFAPILVFTLVAGVMVDRLDRRTIMWRVDAVRTVLVAGFAVAVVLNLSSLLLIGILAFVLGSAETVYSTAAQSILPSAVSGRDLTRANSRLYSSTAVCDRLVGPPLGALLFTTVAWMPFGLDAASFAASAALMFGLRGVFTHPRSGVERPLRVRFEVKQGLVWLWRHRLLRSMCGMSGAFSLFSKAILGIEILYAIEVLHLSEIGYGILVAAVAGGSILGSLCAAKIADRLGRGPAFCVSVAAAIVPCIVLALISNAIVAALMFASFGISMEVWSVVAVSLRQALVPKQMLGRVNAAYRFVSRGTAPLGAVVGGILAQRYGLRAPFFASAALLVIVASLLLPYMTNSQIALAEAEALPDIP